MKDENRIDGLQAMVAELGNALSRSERRTARLERTIRWGAMSLALVLVLTLATVSQPFGFALAQQEPSASSKSVEQAIDRLTVNLTGRQSTLGMMGIMTADMNSMTHSMGTSMGRMGKWMPW